MVVRSTGQWAAGKVMGVLNATELASDIAVKSGICKPTVESEAATRCGWVKGLFGGGVTIRSWCRVEFCFGFEFLTLVRLVLLRTYCLK